MAIFNEVWEEYLNTIPAHNRNKYIKTMCEMFFVRGELEGQKSTGRIFKRGLTGE